MRVFLKFHWHVQLTFGVKPMPQQVLIEIATGPRELQWSNYPRVCVFVCVVCLCFFNLCTANKIIKFGSRFQYEQKIAIIPMVMQGYAANLLAGMSGTSVCRLLAADEMQLFTCHIK